MTADDTIFTTLASLDAEPMTPARQPPQAARVAAVDGVSTPDGSAQTSGWDGEGPALSAVPSQPDPFDLPPTPKPPTFPALQPTEPSFDNGAAPWPIVLGRSVLDGDPLGRPRRWAG